MGASLSSRAEWTSASEKGGKLDFSKTNEALLLEILKYVETLDRDHPREATVAFKRPFIWKTSLSWPNFQSLEQNDEYVYRYLCMKLMNTFAACSCLFQYLILIKGRV